MVKKFLLVLLLPVSIVFTPLAHAHRDGCHRWHSCPSDSGTYECGDLGDYSECPNQPSAKPVVSIVSKDSLFDRYMRAGYKAYKAKHYNTALANFRKALARKPGDTTANQAVQNTAAILKIPA